MSIITSIWILGVMVGMWLMVFDCYKECGIAFGLFITIMSIFVTVAGLVVVAGLF